MLMRELSTQAYNVEVTCTQAHMAASCILEVCTICLCSVYLYVNG